MPTHKKAREQAQRQVNLAKQALAPEVIAKRTKRHLEELERTNYAASTLLNDPDTDPESTSNQKSKSRARQAVISDKRTFGTPNEGKRKKSSMNVRTAILYRKGFPTLIEESGLASLPSNVPSYLTASAPPPPIPPRRLCSVCGYKAAYKCKKCAMPYCDMKCGQAHDETRCERRVV
ncbi:hypothetical protein BDN67DRAFT_966227 [Paxillus ammoniavirescens]|nr:hypothetical protein BDN67DRAFT_966227 [Paxillus ammoniavirescens]